MIFIDTIKPKKKKPFSRSEKACDYRKIVGVTSLLLERSGACNFCYHKSISHRGSPKGQLTGCRLIEWSTTQTISILWWLYVRLLDQLSFMRSRVLVYRRGNFFFHKSRAALQQWKFSRINVSSSPEIVRDPSRKSAPYTTDLLGYRWWKIPRCWSNLNSCRLSEIPCWYPTCGNENEGSKVPSAGETSGLLGYPVHAA